MQIINKLWLLLLLPILPVQAQINSDNTLPASTQINPQNNIIYIEQGTVKETNLFHSFAQFSVPEGMTAYFNNNSNIQNIFSRVTGSDISQINGTIKANGNANLFLMNPQGIIFGKNASLNIGGSFLATTANSMKFADNFEFVASNQQTNPLLTISVPVGLQFNQPNAGEITVLGNGHNFYADPIFPIIQKNGIIETLKVQKGQDFTLVGGNINFVGGNLEAPEGKIILASIGAGNINLNNLDITGVSTFKNINMIEQSSLATIGNGGGDIFLAGNNINLKNGSFILVQNIGDKKAGNINVKSNQLLLESVDKNRAIRSGIDNENIANGFGGNVNINTNKLSLTKGAIIATLNFGLNPVGDVNIKANESIDIIGYDEINPILLSVIGSSTANKSDAGNIYISSPKINLIDGGAIVSLTLLSTGNSGNIEINSKEIFLTGFTPIIYQPTTISTSSFSYGNAGNININTVKITLENQGTVLSSTFAQGNAGNININASDSIKITGNFFGNKVTGSLTGISSASELLNAQLRLVYRLPDFPTGASSNITINTKLLSIENNGIINASNISQANSGTLKINADSIFLNQSFIASFTVSKEGGNIILDTNKFILLRNQSLITANALNNGNGGNITINSPFIVALSSENSDIIANAFLGKGGNININALGLFGIEYRDQITNFSDINASSQFGLNGIVNINTPRIDPKITIIKLPSTPIDISSLVANKCKNNLNSFAITGRNGLPNDPLRPLSENYLQVDLGNIYHNSINTNINANSTQNKSSIPELLEAKKWVINEKNQIVLINEMSSNYYFGVNFECK